jgi:hypothetical protein
MRAFSSLNTFVPAGVWVAGVWLAVAPGLTGVALGFELEVQPARQATPSEMVTAKAMVFIVLIFEWLLSGFGLKLQFRFTHTPHNPGALKMIPLLNESA